MLIDYFLTLLSPQRDAYYHPTVDSSDEPFKWGLPDLDALRAYVPIVSSIYRYSKKSLPRFFREELGWGQAKVDEIMLPIIQKMNKRGQVRFFSHTETTSEL